MKRLRRLLPSSSSSSQNVVVAPFIASSFSSSSQHHHHYYHHHHHRRKHSVVENAINSDERRRRRRRNERRDDDASYDDYWKKKKKKEANNNNNKIVSSRGFAASSSSSSSSSSPAVKNNNNNNNNNKEINPYVALARLDKPIGIYLLAYPCLWSILLSSSTAAIPPATEEIAAMTALFSAGAVLLRGAGCTVNDIWDRKVDAEVERTKDRPIASGKITVPNAVAFLGAQLGLGSVILYQLDFNTQILGLMSLPLVVAYPLMKRVTNLPQLFLGFTLNWGALMGWTAITGGVLEAPALALYGSGVCWTMVYDTIYAHQDIDDDKKIGVKSSARLFENNTKGILSTFGIGAISGLLASGYLADAHWAFYPFLLSTAGTHLFWQIYTVDLKNRKDCGDKFRSNQTYGGLVLSSILAAKVAENVL
jgi:4-hydroxybenzoate polyprenyltransferase